MAIDRFKAMQVFARVAELGSFTQAAEALYMPKPTVSTMVQALEAHLGVRLLNRTTRRLNLTADGVAYLARANLILGDLQDLETQVRGALVKPAGRLRVDVPAAMGRHVLMPNLPDFFKRYPEIVLDVGSTDRPVDLVREGIDCVIRGGNVFDETLVARKLGAHAVFTCAAPAYLKKMGKPKTLADLDRHQFVNYFSAKTGKVFPFDFYTDNGSGVKQLQQINRPHQVAANDADSHLAATLAGLGLAQLVGTNHLQKHLDDGRLVRVLKEFDCGELPLFLMYPQNRHLSARVRAFADWVTALYIKTLP
jgi:LysR family transcriptional regulator, regulator for bpeEF and oprC